MRYPLSISLSKSHKSLTGSNTRLLPGKSYLLSILYLEALSNTNGSQYSAKASLKFDKRPCAMLPVETLGRATSGNRKWLEFRIPASQIRGISFSFPLLKCSCSFSFLVYLGSISSVMVFGVISVCLSQQLYHH